MHANLVLFTKGGTQRIFPLSSEITILGRRHDCDLRIPLKLVSRRHCQLSKNNNDLKIRDLDSRCGTFLNGKKVTEDVVNAGDYIRIGPLTFQLQIDGKPEKITPPPQNVKKQAQTKPKPAPQQNKPALDALDSSAELDLSDSFIAELDEL
ncbi:MAG: FHA domain-containing protein [Sedimentisphaerales bacterium]|nr:FHA domain-containing protein [Sedimentisphaerales bacterium]